MSVVPVTLSITMPDPVVGGIVGEFTPVIGGSGGESDQTYRYQTGRYFKLGPFVEWWAYTQFSNQGTINGHVIMKGLNIPTLNGPGFFGGGCSYSSNLSPSANDITSIDCWTSGAQTTWNLYGRRIGQNPRPLTLADLNPACQFILHGSFLADN